MQFGFLLEIAEALNTDRRRTAAAFRTGRAVARAARRPVRAENARIQVPMSAEVQTHAATLARELSDVSR
jgi:hypothetical protein